MTYIIGAYANSPCLSSWNAALETEYFAGLKALSGIRGLEHPFFGGLHRDDDAWFLDHIDPRWDYVLTCIPGTMQQVGKNPAFGLASNDDAGRKAAIEFQERARQAVLKLNRHLKRRAVIAVQIYSAPTMKSGTESSVGAFARSLGEIARWDWDGARLVIEHCDAFTRSHTPEKGFLTVAQELEAIAAAGADVGMMVNWGRSALEGRSADTPVEHVKQMRAAGALRGVIFSGATATDPAYGAWKDMHVAPAPPKGAKDSVLARESLMTPDEIARTLKAAGPLDYVGAKVLLRPEPSDMKTRLRLIEETIALLDAASRSAR